MNTSYIIRPAQINDAGAVADIYNYHVRHSTVTMQAEPTDRATFAAQIDKTVPAIPFFVAVNRATAAIAGYCYADIFKSRCGYLHTYESSVYIAPAEIGQGLGNALMEALINTLRPIPAYKLIAVIALPNPASVAMHKKLGFIHCGTLPAVGWKFNQWIDSSYWMLSLKDSLPENQK